MGKVNVNSRNNYLTTSGILDLVDFWTNQSVTTEASPLFNALTVTNNTSIGGNLIVDGNVTVGGSTTVISTEIVEIQDNIVELNSEETGAGVTLGSAGIEVNRGSLLPYRIVFDEASDDLKIGFVGSLQSTATREDTPLNKGIMVYNETLERLDSTQTIELPINFTSGQASTSSANGSVRVSGGIGMTGDLYTDSGVYFKGSGYNSSIKSNLNDNLVFTTTNDITFTVSGNKKINIPQEVYLNFDNGTNSKRIFNDISTLNIQNTTGNISFSTLLNGNLNIPSGTYLNWGSGNNIRYDATDVTLNSSGDFKIVPKINSTDTTASTSSTTGSLKLAGSIAIANTTDASSSSNGGTFTTTGGMALGKNLFVGNTITVGDIPFTTVQGVNQGVNFRSLNRTLTTISTNNTAFNSIEGGIISTAVVVPTASSLFISGSPTVTGGGSITNAYALNISSGNSLFGGAITNTNNTATTSPTTGSLMLAGGIGISNTTNSSSYLNGGSLTTSGGAGIEKDIFTGGKLDISAVNTSVFQVSNVGVNFRSRNRILTTSSSANTVFNSFDGGSINTTAVIPLSSTVYIESPPSISGGGSITSLYSLFINSGDFGTNGVITSSNTTSSVSSVTGAVKLLGGLGISFSTDAVSATSGGSFTTSGGLAVTKKIYTGSGLFTSVGTAISNTNHINLLNSNLNRFSFGLKDIETGSNTGSNFFISRSDDSGTLIGNILGISRSTGVTTFNLTTDSTSASTGSVVFSGGISINRDTDATNSTNGGSFTTSGGLAVAKKLFVGTDGDIAGNFSVNGITNLDQTNIDTNDGVFSITGTNGVTTNVGSTITTTNTVGSITLDSQAGTLVLDGNNGVTIDSLAGISIDAGASSNLSTTSGTMTISGIGATITGTSGKALVVGNDGIELNTSSITNGVKIGTLTSGVPITIGHSVSETIVGDNLTINGDLTVLGTTTSIESTLITINDNAIIVNNSPSGISDGGFIVRRYQTPNDSGTGGVVTDTIKETSTFSANSVAPDQLFLNASANGSNEYYKGWWIKITSGSGIGQVRRIRAYNGTTKQALIYSTTISNDNGDGIDLTTAVSSGDTYNLYDSPYVGLFFDESANEIAVAGISFDPNQGEFPNITTYYPIHAQSIIIEEAFTTAGTATFDGDVIIDRDSTQALLVRKDGNSGDILRVNTNTGSTALGNPVNTVASSVNLTFEQRDTVNSVQTYSSINSVITNNVSGNLISTLDFKVQNDTEGLTTFLSLKGGVSGSSFIDIPSSVDSLRILSSVASTSNTAGALQLTGGLGISNTTNATSITNGGSFTTAGGLSVAKKMFVGEQVTFIDTTTVSTSLNTLTSTSAGLNLNGDIGLYNNSGAKIVFSDAGQGSPSLTSRSSGTKLVLRGEISGSNVDYAIGNESSAQWYSVPTNSNSHLFYTGTTKRVKIDVSGISTVQPGGGISFDNGSNYSSFKENSETTRFKPHTSDPAKGLIFTDSTDASSRIQINSDGQLSLGLSGYSGAPGLGKILQSQAITFTDNTTAVSGTSSTCNLHSFGQSTISASNLSVTTTNVINAYIAGAPIRGTNQTFTNAYGLYIDSLSDIVTNGTVTTASSVYIKNAPTASGIGTITNAYSLFVDDGVSRFDGKLILPTTSLLVGTTDNTFSTSPGSINTSGDIVLQNNTRQGIFFNTNGIGIPSITNRSSGSKIILSPQVSGSTVDQAIGISSTANWYSVPDTSFTHDFYFGTSLRTSLNSTGITLASSGSGVASIIKTSTSDGSDDQGIIIAGGGSTGISRGAQIEVYGNETSSGNIILATGTSGQINMQTNGTSKLSVLNSGEIVITNTADTTGSGTGSIRTPGGLNVDKSLYVGTEFDLNFNQRYSYTGDVSGRINIQGKTTGISSNFRYFTNDGDNTDNNLLELYGLGTPVSFTNTERLSIGYDSASTEYILKSLSTGSGTTRPLVLQTGTNTDQIKLQVDGSVKVSSTTASTSSSTGALQVAGGVAIANTTNATSSSNGGSFTTAGGMAVAQDLRVGGTVYAGNLSFGMSTPSITISNLVNITGFVTTVKSVNSANGIYRKYSVGFVLTPTAGNTTTTFDFTIPEVVTNFTNTYDIICSINGYHGATPEAIENNTVYAVAGTTTGRVKFTSTGTDTHVLQVIVNYNL